MTINFERRWGAIASPNASASPRADATRPRAARTYYTELLGWPVTLEAGTQRLVLAAGTTLDAITMPSALGELVLADLRIAMLAGAVILGPGACPWTFLTEPANTVRPVVPADLDVLGVSLIPAGEPVVLPSNLDQPGLWSWAVPPAPGQPLSIWRAVMSTARRVVSRGNEGLLAA